MKKKIFVFVLALVAAVCLLASCNDDTTPEEQEIYYTVTFNSQGGSEIGSLRVKSGDLIPYPEEPEKEGYVFDGWKTKEGNTWIFTTDKVTADMTLSAAWVDATAVFDYEVVNEEIVITGYSGNALKISVPRVMAGMPVTTVGARAFSTLDYEKVKQVVLPDSVIKVENEAFYECKLPSVIFEGKLTSIGEKAFYACEGLTKIELGEGIEAVPYQAFARCTSLTSVVLSQTVTLIDENAFEGCTALRTVTLHSSLSTINDSAFVGCSSIGAIYYYGTDANWEAINATCGNEALFDAKFYMYSESEPAADAEGEYWYFERDGSIRIW